MYRASTNAARLGRCSDIHAVLIRGAGERAFCAGGDVRAIYEAGRGISGDRAPDLPFFARNMS